MTEQRTAVDLPQLQWSRSALPQAKKIQLVQDNLNTHRLANLSSSLPAEARRFAERFELHFTPTHGRRSTWQKMRSGSLSAAVWATSSRPERSSAAGGGAGTRTQYRDSHHPLALYDSGCSSEVGSALSQAESSRERSSLKSNRSDH